MNVICEITLKPNQIKMIMITKEGDYYFFIWDNRLFFDYTNGDIVQLLLSYMSLRGFCSSIPDVHAPFVFSQVAI